MSGWWWALKVLLRCTNTHLIWKGFYASSQPSFQPYTSSADTTDYTFHPFSDFGSSTFVFLSLVTIGSNFPVPGFNQEIQFQLLSVYESSGLDFHPRKVLSALSQLCVWCWFFPGSWGLHLEL